jgi:peptide/nickel transport system permease protein
LAAGWSRFRTAGPAPAGLVLVGLLAALALGAPLLPLADPYATDLGQRMLSAGSPGHLLGTDQLGRDLLSRLVWGTRSSLAVGFFAVLIAALIGTLLGLVAGYYRSWLDALLMRGIDVLLAFPYLLLALAIVAVLGPGLRNAMIAIAVANIPFFARSVRGSVLAFAGREFVEAARLGGAGGGRILFFELLPNVLPVIVIMMTTNLGWMVLETAGLSFLGLGAQPPTADLGGMLGSGREFLTTAPRVAILPGALILLLVVGINLVGDGLRDVLDPHLRGEAAPARRVLPPPSPDRVSGDEGDAGDDVLLRVTGLSTAFLQDGEIFRAVDDVSFELAGGERLGLVGESGSGKTVTALSLLGLVPPPGRVTGGRIQFEGADLARLDEAGRRRLRGSRIAYIPQDPMTALNPVLSIGSQIVETLTAHRGIGRRAARERALELLDRVRIPQAARRLDAYPHELSGGMRQRVLIAMALANDPALVIADEATTALDVTVQAEIIGLLDALCDAHDAALIFISHDLAVVARLCSRTLVMYAGRVVEAGAVGTLLEAPAHPYTRALLACTPELHHPDKRLRPIAGLPPPLNDLPAGCHFAPRCEHAQDKCRRGEIELQAADAGHRVRCIRYRELKP